MFLKSSRKCETTEKKYLCSTRTFCTVFPAQARAFGALIQWLAPHEQQLTIKYSKTDQLGNGSIVTMGLTGEACCPVNVNGKPD